MKKGSNKFTLLILANVFLIAMTRRKTKKVSVQCHSCKQKERDFNFQKSLTKQVLWLIGLQLHASGRAEKLKTRCKLVLIVACLVLKINSRKYWVKTTLCNGDSDPDAK